jgi:hypothetical protein
MNALSEYLPLLFVVAFIIISVRKGMNRSKEEELTKTTLPGRKSGSVLPDQEENFSEQTIHEQPKKSTKTTPVTGRGSLAAARRGEKEVVEEIAEPILNIEDMEDVKKALIYTEIFNKKEY